MNVAKSVKPSESVAQYAACRARERDKMRGSGVCRGMG